MANVIKDQVRIPAAGGGPAAGNTAPAGSQIAVLTEHVRECPVIRHRMKINNLGFGITASGGGAADAKGQKLITLPPGKFLLLAVDPEFTVTTGAGLSVATAVFALGTAAATDANASLTSTEADILASQTLGDGTLAAGAAETESATFLGNGTAPVIIGGAAATDIYFNVGGTFTHASVTDQPIYINGFVELYLIDLGGVS